MYVCVCHAVTDTHIRSAVAQGCDSLKEVVRCTNAGTCCGRCVNFTKDLLVQIQQEIPRNQAEAA